MAYSLLLILIIVVLAIIIRSFTVLFHELGHAITAILLTGKTTTIYLGSYGNPKNSKRLTIGKLEIWFKYFPPFWAGGLCAPSAEDISIKKRIAFTVAGPIASLLLVAVAIYFISEYNKMHVILLLASLLISASTAFDFLANIIPNKSPVTLYNGTTIYNDGYQVKQLILFYRLPKKYFKAWELYQKKDYESVAPIFEEAVNNSFQNEGLYRLAIDSFLQLKDYAKAYTTFKLLEAKYALTSNDYTSYAVAKTQTGLLEESLIEYDKSLSLNSANWLSLNNKGYTLSLLERHTEAIEYFNKAIEINPQFSYSFSNRGLAKIKIGKGEEGLSDINHSFTLDSKNSYAYRNLGIYHLDKQETEEALKLFTKAKEFDKDTYMIDDLIAKAKKQ